MPRQVQLLMMMVGRLEVTKRRQPGGDGIVAPRLDLHVVGGIGIHQLDRGTSQEPVHVFGIAAIAAEQPMVPKNPQVTRLGNGLVGGLGNLVRIGQPRHLDSKTAIRQHPCSAASA